MVAGPGLGQALGGAQKQVDGVAQASAERDKANLSTASQAAPDSHEVQVLASGKPTGPSRTEQETAPPPQGPNSPPSQNAQSMGSLNSEALLGRLTGSGSGEGGGSGGESAPA